MEANIFPEGFPSTPGVRDKARRFVIHCTDYRLYEIWGLVVRNKSGLGVGRTEQVRDSVYYPGDDSVKIAELPISASESLKRSILKRASM